MNQPKKSIKKWRIFKLWTPIANKVPSSNSFIKAKNYLLNSTLWNWQPWISNKYMPSTLLPAWGRIIWITWNITTRNWITNQSQGQRWGRLIKTSVQLPTIIPLSRSPAKTTTKGQTGQPGWHGTNISQRYQANKQPCGGVGSLDWALCPRVYPIWMFDLHGGLSMVL